MLQRALVWFSRTWGSLRTRLLLLILLTAAPAFVLIVHNGFEQREQARLAAQRYATALSWAVANGMQTHVNNGVRLLESLAKEPVARNLDDPLLVQECSTLLAQHLRLDRDYANITMIDRQGQVRCSGRPLKNTVNVADIEHFRGAIEHRGAASSGYRTSRITGRQVVLIALPVLDVQGQVLAVASVGLDLGFAHELLGGIPLPQGSILNLVDRDGRRMLRKPQDPSLIGQAVLNWGNLRQAADREQRVSVSADWPDGLRRLTAIVPVDVNPRTPPEYYVQVGLPLDELYAEADRTLLRNLGLLGAALAAALLFGGFFSLHLLVRPIQALAAAARQFGAGDTRARAKIGQHSEIGQLGQAFNDMADELERRETHLKHASELRRQLLARLDSLQDDERRHLARELHDSLGQHLTAMSLSIARGRQQTADKPMQGRLETLQAMLGDVDRELERVIFALRPTELEDHGLGEGVAVYVASWSSVTDVPVDLMSSGLEEGVRLHPRVEAAVFRVIQEALNNIAKYAAAKNVSVSMECLRQQLIVSVEDDGVGFAYDESGTSASGQLSWGLLGMKERIEAVGGSLVVESAVGSGTTILVRVPLSGSIEEPEVPEPDRPVLLDAVA